MNLDGYVMHIGKGAKCAASGLALASTDEKNCALLAMADALEKNKQAILESNGKDLALARESGISGALLDRLLLDDWRVAEMAQSLREVAALQDPVGEVIEEWTRPNGLRIRKVRVPLGVIAVIYESRPNVTAEAAGLCIKSGNAVILRGGSEAINSNAAIARVLAEAAEAAGISGKCIQFIETTGRAAVTSLLKLRKFIDVIIPRGGEGLIKAVVENSKIPVIETGIGNCHIYVDASADFGMAEAIALNAKLQRPGVCNAAEKLVVHETIAQEFLPRIAAKLRDAGVELVGCMKARQIVEGLGAATGQGWYTEYLSLKMGVKVVGSIEEAILHINRYGSGHSEAIVTNDEAAAAKFLREIDAAAVYHNASTRFTDGGEFGFGAEIGISTQKLHARGPMGLRELTSAKFVVNGNGQVR